MKRVKLTVAYDGTNYCGWQVQPNGLAVQEVLNRCLSEFLGTETEVIGASRTDAGVHALRQIANYRIPRMLSRHSCSQIQEYFNQYLPQDIRVLAVEKAPERFHARLSATSKIYEYRIDCGAVANIFDRRYLLRIEEPLNIEKMKERR